MGRAPAIPEPVVSSHDLRVQKRLGLAGLISFSLPVPRPLPKHLHTPGSNGRYSTIQCRISHSSLTSLLRDWSSFVLVEGYSYVKLLSRWAKCSSPFSTPQPCLSF